jgi:retinol dehydrogenase-12
MGKPHVHSLAQPWSTHLISHSGVMYPPIDMTTSQDFDLQFGTNVLGTNQPHFHMTSRRHKHLAGHFYLTKLLLPVLTATAKKSSLGTVRVVNVSSIGHYLRAPEGIRWATLTRGDDSLAARKQLGTTKLYGQSKLVKRPCSL